ncbi:MotB family protein [Nitratireductor pacificus]|uniref:Flagellar motor protein MotB n=1 Tax=Nitratireductor pacificus pht-3B TaxID=391937 RepID=K2MJ23_9HYPH|nr:MotB family protein [Nitratireductor pacificus]EKF17142.1 flagellar motor protein MotB [Nitratireductor pacificus pht-3B]
MSVAESEARPPEIIIVRRGGGDEEEGHHGGAWKIAFADFMTAMMCFFLVMWLINATNEQTRSALASYFNPVKLIDRTTSTKGLEDLGEDPDEATPQIETDDKNAASSSGEQEHNSGPMDFEKSIGEAAIQKLSDESLFSDPYSVLAEIAAETGTQANISEKGEGGAQTAGPSSGATGGESYRDPFAPDFWSQQVATPDIGVQGDPDQARDKPAGAETETATEGANRPAAGNAEVTTEVAPGVAMAPVAEVQPLKPSQEEIEAAKAEAEAAKAREAQAAETTEETAQAAPQPRVPSAQSEAIAANIRSELAREFANSPLAGSVTVVATEDGVIVSITDDNKQGMFPVGSAVPERELVLAMDKIGGVLTAQTGLIKIRGHTDGRPFRSETYDNWRLSTARAQAAYYMLVRGGLDEQRIEQVAGFADRKLKVPDDPYADANRRIEILLELPQ